eukprot:g4230.t1
MKTVLLLFVVCLINTCLVASLRCTEEATYKVSVFCDWNAEKHPRDYPSGAHFSLMCGTVHNSKYTMWKLGGKASKGVQDIAELGDCRAFINEVEECDKQGTCSLDAYFDWPCRSRGHTGGVCKFTGELTVSPTYPLISMLTMLAPSPDWMVGVNSVNLCTIGKKTGRKRWMKRCPPEGARKLNALDAGTDDGPSFNSADKITNPRGNITEFNGETIDNIFYNDKDNVLNPICTITFTLQE